VIIIPFFIVVLLVFLCGALSAETATSPHEGNAVFASRASLKTGDKPDNDTTRKEIAVEAKEDPPVVDMSALKKLSQVIESVSGKKIVYVGEYHDNYAHHNVQLEVIKGLYRKNKRQAIGMEMFQRPFQKVLDDYIKGDMDEREFLRRSEYFGRWRFDYNLYKPILDFARAEKVPVIALNQRKEIVEKVAKLGLEGLTPEEKREIPEQLDFSDKAYKEKLKEVFALHTMGSNGKFDFFFQSQVLWDETMSQSIDDFFRGNPDFRKDGRMVVLAGVGHLAFGSGIPKRTHRRNGYDYAVILNDKDIEKDIADYIVQPKHIEGETSPKLMVALKEDEKKGPVITGFPENSVSEKAGLRTGDVIVSFDGNKVGSMEDLRLELFFKKKGDTAKVKVLRKVLFWDLGKEFEVKL